MRKILILQYPWVEVELQLYIINIFTGWIDIEQLHCIFHVSAFSLFISSFILFTLFKDVGTAVALAYSNSTAVAVFE